MAMTVKAIAAGYRIVTAAGAALTAAAFGLFAIGKPLEFLASAAPVEPDWAVHAWAGPLAGLPMAALAYFSLAMILRAPSGHAEWEDFAARCLRAGLSGLGAGALWAAIALGASLAIHGPSPVHLAGAGLAPQMIGVLAGLGIVVGVNLVRMSDESAWMALGHILWGFLGVVALAVGVPMLADAVSIDDGRTLMKRFNLFIVFYPVLWLTFAALAASITGCGLMWLRFGVSPYRRNELPATPSGDAWPSAYGSAPEIQNKAA